MSQISAIFRRTVSRSRSLYSTALAYAAYLAGSGTLLAFNLESAEASRSAPAAVWALSAAPFLPIAAAFAGMHAWSEERANGTIDLLLSAPVRERELTAGKFFGVWLSTIAAAAAFLASSVASIAIFAPKLHAAINMTDFLPGFLAIAMQSAVWSAIAVAASVCMTNPAAAATVTITICAAAPRIAWAALAAWSGGGRSAFGDIPIDAHVFDFASGTISTGTAIAYVALTWFALFFCSKRAAMLRLRGSKCGGARFAANTAILLAAVFASLAATLAHRLDITLDLPTSQEAGTRFSARTRNILSESRGSVTAIAFLPRHDRRWRETARFLRSIERESREVGGARIYMRYVDPGLDLGEARRLSAAGIPVPAVAFERDERIAGYVAIDGDFGERAVASVIERIATPFRRRAVYWTTGHGEASFDDYGICGMSDMARDLALDGYACKKLALASGDPIDDDCALIIAAGPQTGFSEAEAARLTAYLEGRGNGNEGGRLLYLAGPGQAKPGDTLLKLLSRWGMRVSSKRKPIGEVAAGGFNASHPVTRPLVGEQAILDQPSTFEPANIDDESSAGADRTRFTRLLSLGDECFAAAAERGAAATDLAVRPTRIIAVGDALFVSNASLRSRANANRDFFLNAVKYLSGRDAMTDAGVENDRLVTGMDKNAKRRFALCSAAAIPIAALLAGLALVTARRRG